MGARGSAELTDFAKHQVDMFVNLLGLTPGTSLHSAAILEILDQEYWTHTSTQTAAVFSRLAALHLPIIAETIQNELIDEDLGIHDLVNGYIALLPAIEKHATGYLVKYVTTNKKRGAALTEGVARCLYKSLENVGDAISSLDITQVEMRHIFVNAFSSAFSVLLCLLAHTSPELRSRTMSPTMVTRLTHLFKSWTDRYMQLEPNAAVFQNMYKVLRTTPFNAIVLDQVADFRGSQARCAYDGCTDPSKSVFQCKTCRTVSYCSKSHQTEHWDDLEAPHKAVCYKTRW
ncbi:hypothetical protein CALCODRAFT_180462 [Calocera cornea HHB12733]|uniref:MYND-type domain-containing protein n=1 Tax=Calocera cornea HHB12733 TaxID=1353952 RepID=A0A165CCE9_9BASI|nr:hypothetical protein CALCODRAFT_180462 [Calocera cornea HHB12733]